ncbi:MAG: GNAT family N-acetyltransferase [Candidatus Alcyoniella australis]|nr:GNAT family N-acetyltransferase [Candidatus Alcyoniella australis]
MISKNFEQRLEKCLSLPRERLAGELELRCGYYNQPRGRACLNAFAARAFPGFDFSPWNALGYEFDEYRPYSYFLDDQIVANVSASTMNLVVDGAAVEALQIGTVATIEPLRRRGLIRSLFSEVFADHPAPQGLMMLFANQTSAGFYQQFGFRRVTEHAFQAPAPKFSPPMQSARTLDLKSVADRDLLRDLAQQRAPVSRVLGVQCQSWLLMFHAPVVYPTCLHYIEPLKVVAISTIQGRTLRLIDVIGTEVPSLDAIYPFIGGPQVETVDFEFTPDLMGVENLQVTPLDDSLALVRGPFPIEHEPFGFPATSEA